MRLAAAQAERLRDIGKEAVEELRAVVRKKVGEAIEGPIREARRRLVAQWGHRGLGARIRILQTFHRLAVEASEAAFEPSVSTLLARYTSVQAEIQKKLAEWERPLDGAARALVAPYEDRSRGRAAEKQQALAELKEIHAQAPWLDELVREPHEESTVSAA